MGSEAAMAKRRLDPAKNQRLLNTPQGAAERVDLDQIRQQGGWRSVARIALDSGDPRLWPEVETAYREHPEFRRVILMDLALEWTKEEETVIPLLREALRDPEVCDEALYAAASFPVLLEEVVAGLQDPELLRRAGPDPFVVALACHFGGGSNSSRCRLWKVALQEFSEESGLSVSVCHFPPGTSKWNKIEHRMFCQITQNWRGRPLTSHEVIVNLIGKTTTSTGLTIQAGLDESSYPTKKSVRDEELAAVRIQRAEFHGEWNYTIRPQSLEDDAVIS
jgi:hypothetical protein